MMTSQFDFFIRWFIRHFNIIFKWIAKIGVSGKLTNLHSVFCCWRIKKKGRYLRDPNNHGGGIHGESSRITFKFAAEWLLWIKMQRECNIKHRFRGEPDKNGGTTKPSFANVFSQRHMHEISEQKLDVASAVARFLCDIFDWNRVLKIALNPLRELL